MKQRKPYDNSNRPLNSDRSVAQRMKREVEKSDFSPFARMMFRIAGYTVTNTKGKEVPKFILWEKIGKCENEQYNQIMNMEHPDYVFFNKKGG
jgi:hypothetical protein